jgi:hypothetical protein
MGAPLSILLCANGIAGNCTSQAPTILEGCAAYAIDLVGFFEFEMGLFA